MLADMHTHSEYSHDSVCPIEEMYRAEANKGCAVFAVTDHCDVFSYVNYDIFTPLKNAADTVAALKRCGDGKCLPLAGVEISEGFWFPEQMARVYQMADYDVVIGSVHCVKYKDIEIAYSKIRFDEFSDEDIEGYLAAYFADVLKIAREYDMDILAHLTCPIRYICGKYKRAAELSAFSGVIDQILRVIIERGIALEVNTSTFAVLGDFFPPLDTVKRYLALGGRLITLGSDAHIAENAACHFDEAVAALKSIGVDTLYYHQNRKPIGYRI